MLTMETRIRTFERFGKQWRPPQACKVGGFGDHARWVLIRDGLRECIEHLPLGERAIETKLQEVWIMVAAMAEGSEVEEGGTWLIPS